MRTLTQARSFVGNRPNIGDRWVRIAYILTDSFFVILNSVAVFHFRFVPDWLPNVLRGQPVSVEYPDLGQYLAFLSLYVTLIILFCQSQDLYRVPDARSWPEEFVPLLKAVTFATVLLAALIYLSGVKTISRLVIGSAGLLNLTMLAAWRLWKREIVARRVADGHGVRNVLIVGTGKVGQDLAYRLDNRKHLGFKVKGFLDSKDATEPRVLGRLEELSQIARYHFVDEIIITDTTDREMMRKVALEARRNRLDVKLVPEMFNDLGWQPSVEYLGDIPLIALHKEPIPALGLLLKRIIDVVLSSLILAFSFPVMVLIGLVIRLDSPGPVFYAAQRVGKKGRKFICFKFRTMVPRADEIRDSLRHRNERHGPVFKMAQDPRLTRVGKFLRKYSLDELPQFWNVLKGEMSMVGPRPHPMDDFRQYDLEHFRRLDVTPGITGLWQVYARRDPSFKRNVELDVQYIESWNLRLDFEIMLRTIPAVVRGDGR